MFGFDPYSMFEMSVRMLSDSWSAFETAARMVSQYAHTDLDTARSIVISVLSVSIAFVATGVTMKWFTLGELTGYNRVYNFFESQTAQVSTPVIVAVFLYGYAFPEKIPLLQLGATLALILTIFRALRHLEERVDADAAKIAQSLSERSDDVAGGAHVKKAL